MSPIINRVFIFITGHFMEEQNRQFSTLRNTLVSFTLQGCSNKLNFIFNCRLYSHCIQKIFRILLGREASFPSCSSFRIPPWMKPEPLLTKTKIENVIPGSVPCVADAALIDRSGASSKEP